MRALWLLALLTASAHAQTQTPFTADDLAKLVDLTEPAFSPDGRTIVYTATAANLTEDASQSDLWLVDYASGKRTRLTEHTEEGRIAPAMVAGRQVDRVPLRSRRRRGEDAGLVDAGQRRRSQTPHEIRRRHQRLRALARRQAHRLHRARSRTPLRREGTQEPAADRHRALSTARGRRRLSHRAPLASLRARHRHRQDRAAHARRARRTTARVVARRQAARLRHQARRRSGSASELRHLRRSNRRPARRNANSPRSPAPTSIRIGKRARPGAPTARASRTCAAARTSGSTTRRGSWRSSMSRPGTESIPAPIDRCFTKPRWSADGKSVYALIEQPLVTHLSRIDLADGTVTPLTTGPRFDYDLDVSRDGRIVVLGGGDLHPYDIAAVEPAGLRTLADHNAFLEQRQLAPVEELHFRNGDVELEGLLVKPIGYVEGRRYPTIVRLHGGPVYQFSHEFMADWQAYAAQGFAVVALNPRGGSGRGFDFAKAIYADWGNVDASDVLAGVDHVVALGIADPRSPRHRRLELRRDPHQRRHRARPTLQGRHQRRRRLQHVRHVRARPVHPRIHAGTRHAVGRTARSTTAPASPSCTATGSRPRPCSSAAKPMRTCPAWARSRCTRPCARATCPRSWWCIRAKATGSLFPATSVTA